MKEKKKIFWIIGLSLILLTICIIGIIVIKNIYMKDKYCKICCYKIDSSSFCSSISHQIACLKM